MIYIPFQVGFESDPRKGLFVFEMIKDVIFFIDMLLNFHTAFIYEANLITAHNRIVRKYLNGWFIPDLLACLPYRLLIETQLIIADNNPLRTPQIMEKLRFTRILLLTKLVRIARLKKIIKWMRDISQSEVINGITSLLKLLFYVLFLAHTIACLWHFVGVLVMEYLDKSWLMTYDLIHLSVAERYVASLYWTLTTMMTVGYGDITPATMPERLVSVFAMLVGCGIFGYSMNSIGILLQNMNERISKKRYVS